MTGTFHSTGGFRGITRPGPRWDLRLAVFALAAGLVVVLILWIQRSVGSRMAALEQKFGNLGAASFYVGIEIRFRFRQLNERLLDYHFDPTADHRALFLQEAQEFRRWLENREVTLTTPREHELFDSIQDAFEGYLAGTRPMTEAGAGPAEAGDLRAAYDAVRKESRPLFHRTEEFVGSQQQAFKEFLGDSQQTLLSLRQLLTLSLVLLLAATVALAMMVYRGMIAPLRQAVTESRAIIERQEKLASLGTLAAGVAHEIRNPLTAIKFRLFSLRNSLPPEFPAHEDAGVIGNEIGRLDRIVKDFLQFARPSDPEAVRVPAERILQEVHALLAPELEKLAIQLRLETDATTWIHADVQQLKQVLINLVQNAADSIGRDGGIRLGVRPDTVALAGRSRPAAILRVTDTGKGIPPEVQKRLFDPFFSTKEGGTGLGLAIAARIVEKHGGLLRYQTELDQGTTFEIVLPRLDDHASPVADH
jgi:signal transduction histidine kinase